MRKFKTRKFRFYKKPPQRLVAMRDFTELELDQVRELTESIMKLNWFTQISFDAPEHLSISQLPVWLQPGVAYFGEIHEQSQDQNVWIFQNAPYLTNFEFRGSDTSVLWNYSINDGSSISIEIPESYLSELRSIAAFHSLSKVSEWTVKLESSH